MVAAAAAGVVLARASNAAAASALSCPLVTRALRAMAVRTPPGWMQLTETGRPSTRTSCRSASVKPRTANFAAL